MPRLRATSASGAIRRKAPSTGSMAKLAWSACYCCCCSSAICSSAAATLGATGCGTGTEGATVRLYFERFEADPARQQDDVQTTLAPLIDFAENQLGLRQRTGRPGPDVIT